MLSIPRIDQNSWRAHNFNSPKDEASGGCHFFDPIAFRKSVCAAAGIVEMRSLSLWSVFPAMETCRNMHPAPCMHLFGRPSYLTAPNWLPRCPAQGFDKALFSSGVYFRRRFLWSLKVCQCFTSRHLASVICLHLHHFRVKRHILRESFE
jgi:hypothetical protein